MASAASSAAAAILLVTSFMLVVGVPEKVKTRRLSQRATDEALRQLRNPNK